VLLPLKNNFLYDPRSWLPDRRGKKTLDHVNGITKIFEFSSPRDGDSLKFDDVILDWLCYWMVARYPVRFHAITLFFALIMNSFASIAVCCAWSEPLLWPNFPLQLIREYNLSIIWLLGSIIIPIQKIWLLGSIIWV